MEERKMENQKQNVFYVCPNNCPETWFTQAGTSVAGRQLTEDGETMDEETYDFTPTGPVKCRKCSAEAIVRTKTVKTTVEIK